MKPQNRHMELQIIQKKIFEIRGQRVMLDKDLAELYSVTTKHLNQAVRRNDRRFPNDFMFQLTKDEYDSLRSQFVTLKKGEHSKYLPYAFTEHGITMLSGVLKSQTAIDVNLSIVRAFILLKQYNNNFRLLQKRIDELEARFSRKIENINELIEFLLSKPEKRERKKPIKKIGFKVPKKK